MLDRRLGSLDRQRPVILDPFKQRRAVDIDAALGEHLFKVVVADPEFAIPAYGPVTQLALHESGDWKSPE